MGTKRFLVVCLLSVFSFSAQAQTVISAGKTLTASSENGANTAVKANDGNATTRWESKFGTGISDTQWIMVDLGSAMAVDQVQITWEAAYARDYEVQLSNDRNFVTYTLIGKVASGDGGYDSILTDNSLTGRYVRFFCTRKGTGYGYSIFELKLLDLPANQDLPIRVLLPYAQFLRISFFPADKNGLGLLQLQNQPIDTILTFRQGVVESLSVVEKRGDNDFQLFAVKKDTLFGALNGAFRTSLFGGLTIEGRWIVPIDTSNKAPTSNPGANRSINFSSLPLVLDGRGSSDADGSIVAYLWEEVSGPQTVTITHADSAVATVATAVPGNYKFRLTVTDNDGASHTANVYITIINDKTDFRLLSPQNDTVVTVSRGFTLSWEAVPGATTYQVWMNVSKDVYDWYGSGNLLDQYTKIGETAVPSFTVATDLQERWTYRWYVIAQTGTARAYSNTATFSVYHPAIKNWADGISIVNGCRDGNKNGAVEAYENWRLPVATRVSDLMNRMTLAQKVKQCFYGGESDPENGFSFSYGTEGDMTQTQRAAAATALGIPVAFMGDKINGWKNIFPSELGLAATRDPQIAFACGNLQRKEHRYFGFTGTLAPLAEVNTKVLYPRFQEGLGENAEEAAAMVKAMIVGMQGGPEINPHSMLITVKHWPSQGAGGESQLQYDALTIGYHMKPWVAAVEANAASVMPGYNTCPFLDPSNGANSSPKVIAYLRNEIGFRGFIVTDWLAANTAQSVQSMGAGIDVMGGAPSSSTDPAALQTGIGLDRINESCRRVLNVKFRLGMFDNPYGDSTCAWTHADHHAICLNAAKKSITLLENNGVLPLRLKTGDIIVVSGHRAIWPNKDNNPMALWQSIYYDDPDAKTFLEAIQARATAAGTVVQFVDTLSYTSWQPTAAVKAAVVVIGEKSYTHGTDWADKNPVISANQQAIIDKFSSVNVPVIAVVISPRPYVLTGVKAKAGAMLLVYRGGTAMPEAVAALLYGDFSPSGRLPFQEPASVSQIGTDDVTNQLEHWELPYDIGATTAERATIKNLMAAGLPFRTDFGMPLYPYGYGLGFATQAGSPLQRGNAPGPLITLGMFTEKYLDIALNLPKSASVKVRFFNTLGRLIMEQKSASGDNIRIKFPSRMIQGMYIVEVIDNTGASIFRQSAVLVR
jgi:beta-glucosidase